MAPPDAIAERMGIPLRRLTGRKRETVTAAISHHADSVDVTIGDRAFSLRGERLGPHPRQHADFALYGLAAIAMSHNLEIKLDHQVSAVALSRIRELGRNWLRWAPRKVYPLRIHASEVLDDVPGNDDGGILCLSGGVDSTYGALAARESGYTHGLLIGGTDYSDVSGPGFAELTGRVGRIADELDLVLATVNTDITRLKIRWGLFHPLILTMCLRYTGAGLGFGGYAADTTHAEEFLIHPWGNNHEVARLMTTPDFPVHFLGAYSGRSAKARAIAPRRQLLDNLSVCYADTSTGGNCGKCEKCLRTRLNLATGGFDDEGLFREQADLVAYVRRLRVPFNKTNRAAQALFFGDIYFDLPDGELREAAGAFLERLLRPRGGLE